MQRYDIFFDGEISKGRDVEEVKKKLAATFKLDASKVEALFGGKPVLVKRNVDFEMAARYWDAFEKAGAVCRMEPVRSDDPEDEEDDEAGARRIWY